MGKLGVYNFLSVNGFFKGANEDISWAHESASQETGDFAAESAKSATDPNSILLFGRKTYEMMKSYWPTEQAKKNSPDVTDGMNKGTKIVFSKTLKSADWHNTTIVKDNIIEEVEKLKKSGKNMVILGSGSIVTQFANKGLIDEYQLMIHPVAIGNGTPFLQELKKNLDLELASSRPFKSGHILLIYKPKK